MVRKIFTNANHTFTNGIKYFNQREKYFPKRIIEVIYGKYRWSFDEKLTYKEYMKKYEAWFSLNYENLFKG